MTQKLFKLNLYQSQNDADDGVDDQHGDDVALQLVVQKRQAAVNENWVSDLNLVQQNWSI